MDYTVSTFTAHSGFTSAKAVADDGTVRHIHSLVEPETEERHFTDISLWADVLVFLGTGLGYHVRSAVSRLSYTPYIIAIDAFETLLDNFVMLFPSSCACSIVRVSTDSFDRKKETLHNVREACHGKTAQIITHPASFILAPSFYRQVLDTVFPVPSSTSVRTQPAPRASHDTPHTTPCVLTGGHFLEQEMAGAFSRIDTNAVLTFDYATAPLRPAYETRLQQTIQTGKPDFLLSINMKGIDTEGMITDYTTRFGVPPVVWFTDDPHTILHAYPSHLFPHLHALCWERAYIDYLRACGFASVHYLPLAGDPHTFTPATQPHTPTITCGFVGSAIYGDYLDRIRAAFAWDESFEQIAIYAADLLWESPDMPVYTCLQRACTHYNRELPFQDNKNNTWLCAYIIHYASMKKRQTVIEALQDRHIEVFGDPHQWKALVGERLTVHPGVDYHTQLCNTYHSIDTNINITSCQMRSACNQRVFDIPLSGCFGIHDAQDDVLSLFDTPHQSVVTYRNVDELKEKMDWYAAHPEKKEAIIARGRSHILANHCYSHRARAIVSLLSHGL